MILHSHWLDMIAKMVTIILYSLALIFSGVDKIVKEHLASTPNPKFFFFLFISALATVIYFAFYRPVVDVLVTKLYVQIKFKVGAGWAESKTLKRLFCLNKKMQWQPMNHVLELPKEERLAALLEAAENHP